MNKAGRREMLKITTKCLNRIYTNAKDSCKYWERNTVPLNLLHTIIEKETPKEEQRKAEGVLNQHAIMLESLEIYVIAIAKRMDSGSIPLEELEKALKIIKDSYVIGLKVDDEEKAKTNLIKKQ